MGVRRCYLCNRCRRSSESAYGRGAVKWLATDKIRGCAPEWSSAMLVPGWPVRIRTSYAPDLLMGPNLESNPVLATVI